MADFFTFLGGLFSNQNAVPSVGSPIGAGSQDRLPAGQDLFIAGAPNAGVSASEWFGGSSGGMGGTMPGGPSASSSNDIGAAVNKFLFGGETAPSNPLEWITGTGSEGPTGAGVSGAVGENASEWFARGAIVILGFIFVAVGLALFGKPVVETVKNAV